MDRIDIQIEIPRVEYNELHSIDDSNNENSEIIRSRVIDARNIQLTRFKGTNIFSNSQMGAKDVRKHCKLTGNAKELLQKAFDAFGLSARAHDRILKLARTIADLAKKDSILDEHIAEAIQYRILDRKV